MPTFNAEASTEIGKKTLPLFVGILRFFHFPDDLWRYIVPEIKRYTDEVLSDCLEFVYDALKLRRMRHMCSFLKMEENMIQTTY